MFGGGARAFLSKLSNSPKDSLASDAGLALARKTTGGCQFCWSVDPLASWRLYLTLTKLNPTSISRGTVLERNGPSTRWRTYI